MTLIQLVSLCLGPQYKRCTIPKYGNTILGLWYKGSEHSTEQKHAAQLRWGQNTKLNKNVVYSYIIL